MPALNIIAIHETVLNSGCSSSRPSRMRPKRLNASHSAKTTKPVAARMKPQPPPRMTPLSIALDAALRLSVPMTPQATKITASAAPTPKTTQSVPCLRSAADSAGTPPGPSPGITGRRARR